MKAKEFGDRLTEALETTGRSKLGFAKELQARRDDSRSRGEPPLRKADRSALYAFLQGRDLPPVDTLGAMAEILGVRLAWLAEGEEPVERDLTDHPSPIWVVDGHKNPGKRFGPGKRGEARLAFQEIFFPRSKGFECAEPIVRVVFQEILSRRLARRRSRGDRGPLNPAYRANTARSLYLKCFLDVMDDLPPETDFPSPEFTAAFLSRVGGWLEDEER